MELAILMNSDPFFCGLKTFQKSFWFTIISGPWQQTNSITLLIDSVSPLVIVTLPEAHNKSAVTPLGGVMPIIGF